MTISSVLAALVASAAFAERVEENVAQLLRRGAAVAAVHSWLDWLWYGI